MYTGEIASFTAFTIPAKVTSSSGSSEETSDICCFPVIKTTLMA